MVKKIIGIKNIFNTILFLNIGEVFFPPHPFHLHVIYLLVNIFKFLPPISCYYMTMSVITAAFTQFFPFSAWEWTVEAQCGCCFSKLQGIVTK
jgi:hypothetical protein